MPLEPQDRAAWAMVFFILISLAVIVLWIWLKQGGYL